MRKKTASIPLNTMAHEFRDGIAVAKASEKDLEFDKIAQAHRDEYHVFLLLEKGTATFEIDFRKHKLQSHSIMYIHPYQVHRGLRMDDVQFSALLINNENLNPEYIRLLKSIMPAEPLPL